MTTATSGPNLALDHETLTVSPEAYDAMCALALAEYPLEACGLLAGERSAQGDRVVRFFPCRNTEQSARIYTLDPKDHLRAERAAEDAGLEILGVMHSHTHTEAYPSPTDVAAAPDPDWHYLIVTQKREKPEARTYRIVGSGQITEVRIDNRV
ncbi:MAG: Mov34/MPN/PAD-1 family protein [Actinomycetota bacterium]